MPIIKERERRRRRLYHCPHQTHDLRLEVRDVMVILRDPHDFRGEFDIAVPEGAEFPDIDLPVKAEWSYTEPGIFRCQCGEEFAIESEDVQCPECRRMYNCWGQRITYMDEAGFEAAGGYLLAGESWDED